MTALEARKSVLIRFAHNLKKEMGLPNKAGEKLHALVHRLSGKGGTKAKAWEWLQAEYVARNRPEHVKLTRQKAPKPKRQKRSRADFYASEEWMAVRYQALKLYGPVCQCCGATRKDGVQIHVDHIKPRSRWPELELTLTNLQILCRTCNLGKRNVDETDWR